MTTKLTLTMDNAVIERAKEYAREKNSSVSRIVENYLCTISGSGRPEGPVIRHAPITDSLVGMFHDDGRDYKEVINEAKIERFAKKST
jgi:hypothetical protein